MSPAQRAFEIAVLPVPGYDGLYDVSDHGHVYSHAREWPTIQGRTKSHNGCWLKGHTVTGGYKTVALYKDRVRTQHFVHRLVALAFIPNPLGLEEVNHKNGNRADNRVENLEWVSTPENQRHAVAVRRRRGQWITHPIVKAASNDARYLA